jgi:hypothetical protein
LQQALFGSSFMPDDELMIWTAGVTQWLEWYDYVNESSAQFDSRCPDHVRDNPDSYNTWYKAQVEKEKKGIKNPYKR